MDRNDMFKDIFDSIKMIVRKELEQQYFSSSVEGIIKQKTGNNNTYLVDYKGVEIRAHSFFEEFNPGDNVVILLPDGQINSNNKYILGKTEFRKATEVDFTSFKEEIEKQLGNIQQSIEDISLDNKINPKEKQILLENWKLIDSNYNGLIEQLKKYDLEYEPLVEAYTQYHDFVFTKILNDLENTTELTDEENQQWKTLSSTYFDSFIEYETKLIQTIKDNYFVQIIPDKTLQVKEDTLYNFNAEVWLSGKQVDDSTLVKDWFVNDVKKDTGNTFVYQYVMTEKPVRIVLKVFKENNLVAMNYVDIISYRDGEDGLPGPKGDSSYTHIAYANKTIDGFITDFDKTESEGRDYIGIYVDENRFDSDNPDDYQWSLIKGADGAQGIPGKDGIDGQTAYLHIAYMNTSNNSDGSFSTTDSTDRKYIGQYTDHNQEDSENWEDYHWSVFKGQDGEADYLNIITSAGFTNNKECSVIVRGTHKANINKTGQNGLIIFEFEKNGRYVRNTVYNTMTNPELCDILVTDIETIVRDRMFLILAVGQSSVSEKLATTLKKYGARKIHSYEVQKCAYAFLSVKKQNFDYTSSNFYEDFTDEEDGVIEMSIPLGGPLGFLEQGTQGLTGPQGIPGPKGEDGKTIYTHIAYADDEEGNGFSESPLNKDYLGICVNDQSVSSSNPADYSWSLIKGLDGVNGIDGINGKDGTTYYLHFAYADEISPQFEGFIVDETANNITNKKYLGQYVDTKQEDSIDPNQYHWTRIKGDTGVNYTMSIIGNSMFGKDDNEPRRFTVKIYQNGNLYKLGQNPNIFVDWTLNGKKIPSTSLPQENIIMGKFGGLNIMDNETYDSYNVSCDINVDDINMTLLNAPLGYIKSLKVQDVEEIKIFQCDFEYKLSPETTVTPGYLLFDNRNLKKEIYLERVMRDNQWHKETLFITVDGASKGIYHCLGMKGDQKNEMASFKNVSFKEGIKGNVNIGNYGEYIEIDKTDFDSNTQLIAELREG